MTMTRLLFFKEQMNVVFILLVITTQLAAKETQYTSNFNASCVNDALAGDPVSIPIILNNPGDANSNLPLTETYKIHRYELKDTNYVADPQDLSEVEHDILYKQEPPSSIFDQFRYTIEDYQLLEMKDFRIMFINPSKYRFCINEIYADSEAVKRMEQKKLPFCLDPYNKFPFFFTLYITGQKPLIFRSTIYFIISVYDGKQLVDEKIWPREVIAKVSNNHLKINPLEAKNCGKNYTTLIIPNPQPFHIKINFQNEQEYPDRGLMREVMIPSQKSFKMTVLAKETTMTITTWAPQLPDIRYPKLFLPIYCVKSLEIDFFNIGILNSDRSLVEITIPVTNHAREIVELKVVEAISSTGTVEILTMPEPVEKILPGSHHTVICRLMAHVPSQLAEKTTITVRITYVVASNPKQILETKKTFSYMEFRNPLSMGSRRFIDITKKAEDLEKSKDAIRQNVFPIKNNLNLPLLLVRVIVDEKFFKLNWLKDRRDYIYPNQQKEEFSLQYIGPSELRISPMKYLMMLEFNGNLFIPVEIVIYDHTLQCVFNNIATRCTDLPAIDYGYFRGNSTKFKQLVIRNWNPVAKELEIRMPMNTVSSFGMNSTMNLFGPFPKYDASIRTIEDVIFYYLKGGHFIILTFGLTPLENATSGDHPLRISTPDELFESSLRFKVENGTIALIPQILRVTSAYEKSVEYLNLVSTFSEPYKIKNTVVNSSNINVFFNNHTEIYENQWIGLALVYEPFSRLNMTESCCGHDFALNHFINSLYVFEFRRFTYVSVKVITTTELEVNSTIIIDNKPPKLVSDENISITLLESNKAGEHLLFTFKNIFTEPLKYSAIMIPNYLHEDAKQYMNTVRRTRKNLEEVMFCVDNGIAVKHNFSPQMVRSLFSLEQVPQEVTIEPLENNEYYVGSQRKSSLDSGTELSSYVIDTVSAGARICYKATMSKYLKDLIETKVLNDIAEGYPVDTFLQFVEKQMVYLSKPMHFLTYDEFYDQFFSLKKYCNKFTFPLFRFCHNINIQLSPAHENVLQHGERVDISFKLVGNEREIQEMLERSASFYVTILNNITKYESHQIRIDITEPKLKIREIYEAQEEGMVRITEDPELLKVQRLYSSKTGVSLQHKNTSKEKQRLMPFIIPVSVSSLSNTNSTFSVERVIELTNMGEIDIEISQMSLFQHPNQGQRCSHNGITINQDFCKDGLVIKEGQSKNVSLSMDIDLNAFRSPNGLTMINWFLYSGKQFYFRIVIAIKTPVLDYSNKSYRNSIKCLFLNCVSLLLLVTIIISMKRESELRERQNEPRNKSKIFKTQNYHLLGSKMEKKNKRVLMPISEEIIDAVKNVQEKQIKEYFNSSDESQITSKNQMEEEQPSGNQILSALKDRNNVSVSQESSIDFIDLNAINRSLGEDERLDNEEERSESENESEASGQTNWMTDGDGDEVSTVNFQDFGWGKEDSNKGKDNAESDSYYNVFFTQNPLKKEKQPNDVFHWMQDFSRGR